MMLWNSEQLAAAYQKACLAELEALKPGNVHMFSDGHGMVVQDFIRSAEVSAPVLTLPELRVGQRIYQAVDATWKAVGCNTNLGIILLIGPLVQAALHLSDMAEYRASLKATLLNLSQEDAYWAYQAIGLAKPAGLGTSEKHDVAHLPSITLLEAMQYSETRDSVARQYAQFYTELFEQSLPLYQRYAQYWGRPAWATSLVYLFFLSHFPDSHVARKFGLEKAQALQHRAREYYKLLQERENPKLSMSELLAFDNALKSEGINPGTSADLTVATLFMAHLFSAPDD